MTDDARTKVIERHKVWLNICVRLERASPIKFLSIVVHRLRRFIGKRRVSNHDHGFPAWTCAVPENAFDRVFALVKPDIVIVNSVERPAWRSIRRSCSQRDVPTVLYVREASGVRHLVDPPSPGDLILANAEAHADAVRAVGFECHVVPSVIETTHCIVSTDRTQIVMVNPIALYGIELALSIAKELGDLPFTFVESWPLSVRERASLELRCAALGNAQLLPFQRDPSRVYAHAKILLMLCTVPSRPRVVLEAQANGIPVLAVNRPGHDEAVGDGGILLGPDASIATWVQTLSSMWNDKAQYESLSAAALHHAVRHDATPEAVADKFEDLVARLVGVR